MASLQAESARLRKELEAARNEAKMLRERAPSDGVFSKKDLGELGGNGITSLSLPQSVSNSVCPPIFCKIRTGRSSCFTTWLFAVLSCTLSSIGFWQILDYRAFPTWLLLCIVVG